MGFVSSGWRNPFAAERALLEAHSAELERLGREQTADLVRLVARHERERALAIARHRLAEERFWCEWAGAGPSGNVETPNGAHETRRQPS